MLRPATPLTVLLFAAFAMLLLSVISTPIIKNIPLGTFDGVSFGVFGFCKGDSCSSVEIGYDTTKLFTDAQSSTFDLPTSTRTTLSAILIVHPVAALFTLIMLIMAVVTHMHSPSHSSRYLLLLFIFGILTFLVCLLAFLIDVLLFVPHMAWGSYIVLAATILVALSGLVSCAMRRTVVSRKARKKRIAENAEMSGENYYNRNAHQESATTGPATMQPTVPTVSGGNGPSEKLGTFAMATFDPKKDDRSSDERVPLTATSPSQGPVDMNQADSIYRGPTPPRTATNRSIPKDQYGSQYGNPMEPPPDAYGVRRGPSNERMNPRGRGGLPGPPGGYRGRGNYRGGYGGPYGPPPNARGGYGPPGRGGYGPGPGPRGGYGPRGYVGMRGGRPPPPAYQGNGGFDHRPPPPPDAYGNYGPGPARQGSPAQAGTVGMAAAPYGTNPSMPSISTGTTGTAGTGGFEAYNPDRVSDLPRAESPPPLPGTESVPVPGTVGPAVEMDARTGSPAQSQQGFGQFNQLRDSDADVAGMLALQQGSSFPAHRHDTFMSEGSKYSQDDSAYVPPRQAWIQGPGRNSPTMPSLLTITGRAELASPTSPPQQAAIAENTYYEDVDPRFAEPTPAPLQPGPGPATYDDPHADGPMSPAASEHSVFTSISQRGVNPQWNPSSPGPPGAFGQQIPRRPVNRNEVNVLNSNPDFQLPSSRGGPQQKGPVAGMIPPSNYPGM